MVSSCSTVETAIGQVLAALRAGMTLVVVHGARGTGRTTVCDGVRTRVDGTGVLIIDDADRHTDLAGLVDRSAPPGTPVVLALSDATVVGVLTPTPTWIPIGSLSLTDVTELAEPAGVGHASKGAIRGIDRLTGGNLRTLVEFLAHLPAGSLTTWETLGTEHLRSLPVTVEARNEISRVSPATRAALCLAAHADDEPLSVVERAMAACNLGLADLAPAEAWGLIEIDVDGVRFARPVDRFAAREAPPLVERRQLVAALAAASHGEPIDRSAWFEAQWLARPDDELADRLDRLGQRELAEQLPLRAAATWQLAHNFRAVPDGRELLRAADAVLLGGEFELAAHLAERARATTERAEIHAAAARINMLVTTWSGRPDATMGPVQSSGTSSAAGVETTALLLQATLAAVHSGRLEQATDLAARAAELAAHLGPLGTAARAIAGYTASLRGEPEGRCSLDDAMTLHHDIAPLVEREPAALHLTSWVGRILAEGGHPAAAAEMLAWTIRTADALGARQYAIMPTAHRALLRLRYDGPRSAADDVARLEVLVDEFGLHEHRATADLVHSRSDALVGDPAASRRLRDVAARSSGPAAVEAYLTLGVASLAGGDIDAALSWLQSVADRCESVGLAHPGFLPYEAELVEVLVRCGRPVEAAEVAQQHQKVAAGWGDPFVTALAERSAGLTSADPDANELHLQRSIEILEDLGAPLEAARSMLCLGEQRRRRRRRAAAREPLRSAQLAFERLGATAWSARCADELRAAGANDEHVAEGRYTSAVATLTNREHRIATLAATGATNREIATALYVSPKTVENQLTRVYSKLRVRSRTELGRLLDRVG